MAGAPLDDRAICAGLMAAGAVLLARPPRARARRALWLALLAAGLVNAVILSFLPANLVNINVVHHYLGARYAVPYDRFYELTNAALGRPPIGIRDLRHPPGMVRADPREARAWWIDLLREAGVPFDPVAPTEELRKAAEASGALAAWCARTLRDVLPPEDAQRFTEDVRRAILVEHAERNVEAEGRSLATDYGYNGSPLYTLLRKADPTLHRPFGRAAAVLNLVLQLASVPAIVLLLGAALGLARDERLAMAALLLASWDFVGWELPGLVLAEWWLPVAVALFAMSRAKPCLAGAAAAWAGLIKLFPFVLLVPPVVAAVPAAFPRSRARRSPLRPAMMLACATGATVLLAAVSVLSGRSWIEFGRKIVAEFHGTGYLMNSVSMAQFWLAAGSHDSPILAAWSLAGLATIVALFAVPRDEPREVSWPRLALVALGSTGLVVRTWFNYYGVAPLLLLPLVARSDRRGAAIAAAAMAAAFLLPEYDHPALLEHGWLNALKVAPYVAIPIWLIARELPWRPGVRRSAVLAAIALLVVLTGADVARQHVVKRLDRRGNAELDRGDAAAALGTFRRFARLAPCNATARMDVGIALAVLERYGEAEKEFARAVEMDPGMVDARLNHGLVLARLGDRDRAAREFEAAIALEPWNDAALIDLARLRASEGRHAEVRRLIGRAMELDPRNRGLAVGAVPR